MSLQGYSAVETALQDTWSYLPSLLAALAILVLGWLASTVLGALVRGGIRRTTAGDKAVQWVRGEEPAPPMDVASIAGRLAFWIGMLFVLVAFFQVLNLTLVTEPLNALLAQVAEFLPRLIGAAILLVIAWVVAAASRRLVATVLGRTRFDERIGAGSQGRWMPRLRYRTPWPRPSIGWSSFSSSRPSSEYLPSRG